MKKNLSYKEIYNDLLKSNKDRTGFMFSKEIVMKTYGVSKSGFYRVFDLIKKDDRLVRISIKCGLFRVVWKEKVK